MPDTAAPPSKTALRSEIDRLATNLVVGVEMAGGRAEPVPRHADLIIRIRGAAQPLVSSSAKADEAPPNEQRADAKSHKVADFSVRVETQKLDSLMDMVGEMVIAQSLVRNNPSLNAIQNPRLLADLTQLGRITAEVQRTTTGEYAGERFAGSLLQQVRPHLTKSTQKSSASFQVKKEVRDLVEFRRQNLMQDFSNLGPFPLIFCRNVMIYFDSSTQQELVRRLTDALEPDGYLFVGHAESLNRIQHSLEYIQPAIYRKQERNRSLKNRARVGL
jgi:hypothetical protein